MTRSRSKVIRTNAIKPFSSRLTALVQNEHCTPEFRLLAEIVQWGFKHERRKVDCYPYHAVVDEYLYAKLLHNVFVLVDSHISPGEPEDLKDRYHLYTGFRFSQGAYGSVSKQPVMPSMCDETRAHMRSVYPVLCWLLFSDDALGAKVLQVLETNYAQQVTLDRST